MICCFGGERSQAAVKGHESASGQKPVRSPGQQTSNHAYSAGDRLDLEATAARSGATAAHPANSSQPPILPGSPRSQKGTVIAVQDRVATSEQQLRLQLPKGGLRAASLSGPPADTSVDVPASNPHESIAAKDYSNAISKFAILKETSIKFSHIFGGLSSGVSGLHGSPRGKLQSACEQLCSQLPLAFAGMYAISDPIGSQGSLAYAVVAQAGKASEASVLAATYGSPSHINMQVFDLSNSNSVPLHFSRDLTAECLLLQVPLPRSAPSELMRLIQQQGLLSFVAVPIRRDGVLKGALLLGAKDAGLFDQLWVAQMQLAASILANVYGDSHLSEHIRLTAELQACTSVNALALTTIAALEAWHKGLWCRFALTSTCCKFATIIEPTRMAPWRAASASTINERGNREHQSAAAPRRCTTASLVAGEEISGAGCYNGSLTLSGVWGAASETALTRFVITTQKTCLKALIKTKRKIVVSNIKEIVLRTGQLLKDLFTQSFLGRQLHSALVLPLLHRGGLFGAVYLMSTELMDFSSLACRTEDFLALVPPLLSHLLATQHAAEMADVLVISDTACLGLHASPGGSTELSSMGRESMPSIASGEVGSLGTSGRRVGSLNLAETAAARASTTSLVNELLQELHTHRAARLVKNAEADKLCALEVQHMIGRGGYGHVFHCIYRGQQATLKVMLNTSGGARAGGAAAGHGGSSLKGALQDATELAVLTATSHPNIVQVHACLTNVPLPLLEQQFTSDTHLSMFKNALERQAPNIENVSLAIMEYCDGGSLKEAQRCRKFHDTDGNPRLQHLVDTLIEVANAVDHLHGLNVVHCDLKPENVVLKSTAIDSRGFTAKLVDFGLSRVVGESGVFVRNSGGTVVYVAPEMFGEGQDAVVDKMVDVFAFGIIAWETISGVEAYEDLPTEDILPAVCSHGQRPPYLPACPSGLWSLMQHCWQHEPRDRPTFDEIVRRLGHISSQLRKRQHPQAAGA